jgi:hypothetical protein
MVIIISDFGLRNSDCYADAVKIEFDALASLTMTHILSFYYLLLPFSRILIIKNSAIKNPCLPSTGG